MTESNNKTQFAILGMLSAGPKSGYEIKKGIDSTLGNFWRENFGHIYPILRRLEEAELAKGEAVAQIGRPQSRKYTITPKGLALLREWLLQPTDPMAFRHELLLKFFFSGQISGEEQKKMVREYGDRMRKLKVKFDSDLEDRKKEGSDEQQRRLQMTNRFGILYCKACVEWADETLSALENLPRRVARRSGTTTLKDSAKRRGERIR